MIICEIKKSEKLNNQTFYLFIDILFLPIILELLETKKSQKFSYQNLCLFMNILFLPINLGFLEI